MKKIQYILLAALLFLGLGCEKELDSEDVSRVTTYLTYELTGGELVAIPLGTAYSEPGFKAMEGSTDVSSSVTVEGTVNSSKIGVYRLTYSAENSDGFLSTTRRRVVVYDPSAPATDISGDYITRVARVAPARAFNDLNVTIEKLAPGFFYVSDFLGGFYDQGSNYQYGPAYAMTGYVTIKADNTLTLVSSYLSGWGDSLNKLENAVFNPETQTITWDAFYTSSNYNFKVTMVKENN